MPGLLRLGLGHAHACDLRVAERRPGDQVLVDGMCLDAGGVLNGYHSLLGCLVGERLPFGGQDESDHYAQSKD